VVEYEGHPGRRPLTYDEVQALFDALDGRVDDVRARGRKGVRTALRDAALLKTVYAFGLRRNEARMLDLADLRRAQKTPQYRQYGGLFVRYGKASRGSPPKRRTVLTVPEMDWIVDVLEQWVTEIRPLFSPGSHPALFVTERAGRMSLRGLNVAFSAASQAAGLPPELDLHSLRHSYVTHLVEFDYPERFVSLQVGHEYASTTAIYTGISDEYRDRLVRRALTERYPQLWEN
jgi:site-specific recombinase XerD